MAYRLKNLVVDRVDLCKKGANPESHIMLFKTKEPVSVPFGKAMTTNQILAYRAAWDEWYELKDAFMCSINQIMYDGANADLLQQTVKEFATANAAIGKVLESSINKSADTLSLDAMFKQLAEAVKKDDRVAEITALFGKFEAQKGDIMKFDKSKLPVDAQTELAAIEKSATDAIAELDVVKKEVVALKDQLEKALKPAPTSIDEIKKSMTPTQLATYELMEKSQKETNERLAKAEANTLVEKTARRQAEFKKTAETTMKFVPGMSIDQIAKTLMLAEDKFEKADYDALVACLQTASTTIEKSGLLRENGDAGTVVGVGKAWDEANKIAEELRKADPKLTKEGAIAKAFEQNPKLYQQHNQEQAA